LFYTCIATPIVAALQQIQVIAETPDALRCFLPPHYCIQLIGAAIFRPPEKLKALLT
jgi:hypothetical protein